MDARSIKLACAVVSLLASGVSAADWPAARERRTSFDAGWRFQKGDAAGTEKPDFDDSKWRALDLPHDWAIEGPFDPAISPHQGALPFFGVAWYRKHFTLPPAKDGEKGERKKEKLEGWHSLFLPSPRGSGEKVPEGRMRGG